MEDAALAEVERAKSCALFDATTGGALREFFHSSEFFPPAKKSKLMSFGKIRVHAEVSHNVEIDAKLDLILRQLTGVNAAITGIHATLVGIKAGVRLQNFSQKQVYCVGWYGLYLSTIVSSCAAFQWKQNRF
jgi:hypothetical protein